MNILIFGASGFIGRNMTEYFSNRGYKILAQGNARMPASTGNVLGMIANLTTNLGVRSTFEEADHFFNKEPYTVIQAAATTSGAKEILGKPWYHVADNAVMNSLILREAKEHNIENFIFFSCTVMYADINGKVNEDTRIWELSPSYFGVGNTKIYIEKMCEFYSRFTDTNFICIRHSNVYGPHDKYDLEKSHFFGANITKVLTSKEGQDIVVWGSGNDSRDLIHVKDLCIFADKYLNSKKNKFDIVNVGCGKNFTTNEVVNKIVKYSGLERRTLNDMTKPSIPANFKLIIDKAENQFNWKPQISLDDGIQATINWYKKNYTKE